MKHAVAVAVFLFLLSGCAARARRPIDGPEQQRRMLDGAKQVVSPACAQPQTIPVKVAINEQGRVIQVQEFKGSHRQSLPGSLLEAIRSLLLGSRFTPVLISGKPTAVDAILRVRCVSSN